ncbi:prolipoprotein diacylglyceryl transferase family protein [Desulfogranum mediterraneum]|uniref:prolipoprotein diacylglyceryl transferase family protein n=1 Tax=Desulfogranum mediterraneum TaxID=160661 RepID=UPI00040C4B51|nr:prolipoprotein diacylglyceryl transferase family protein [Desulfogranum mediterraneum]
MNLLFICCSTLLFAMIIVLGLRYLPGEQFQMVAVVPARKQAGSSWEGVNFTWYGLVIAGSTCLSLLYALILLRAAAVPLNGVLALFALILAICIPAAGTMARLVEKKRYTFTIGGAFFCGMVIIPWAILGVNQLLAALQQAQIDTRAVLAAMGIAYILGEGLGRLACLSFGCCYGKPLAACSPRTRRLLAELAVVFEAPTKKAVYEGALAGEKLIPIQGITSLVYTSTGLLAAGCYLRGWYCTAFLSSLLVSQLWRFFSETLRADFRGFGTVSAYQKMSLAVLPYGVWMVLKPLSSAPTSLPSIGHGLTILGEPLAMISLQLLCLLLFFHFGRSRVTASTLEFQVVEGHT